MLRLAVTTRAETYRRLRGPLADRGIDVEYVQPSERVFRVTDPGTAFDGFDVGFVFPGRLMEGGVLDALLSVPWVNDRASVLASRNKAGVLASLAAADLPVPVTRYVSNPVDDDAVLEAAADLSFPLVVKPNSTTRGVGVAKVTDRDSLLGVVDYLELVHDYRATGDKSFLLQEFLPGATDYRAMVVDGEYAGAVERRLPADAGEDRWKHNVHRGAVARGVDLPARHRQLVERVASTLEIPLLGVDLLETEERLVVSETNARPTVDSETKYEPGFYDRLASLVRQTADE